MQGSCARSGRCREIGTRDDGFTLIELLIVVVILAVLAAVVVFAVQNLTNDSAVAACRSDFKTVETATETFKAQMGAFPGGTYDGGIALSQPSGTEPGSNAGILDMMGTATTNSGTVGPWLKEYPYNIGHYQIEVKADGSGTVSVYNTASPAVSIGASNGVDDCAGVN